MDSVGRRLCPLLVALFTIQFHAETTLSPPGCQHPGATVQGRRVANVLPVPALQVRDPVPLFVRVESGDLAFQNTDLLIDTKSVGRRRPSRRLVRKFPGDDTRRRRERMLGALFRAEGVDDTHAVRLQVISHNALWHLHHSSSEHMTAVRLARADSSHEPPAGVHSITPLSRVLPPGAFGSAGDNTLNGRVLSRLGGGAVAINLWMSHSTRVDSRDDLHERAYRHDIGSPSG
jgi:hypothetical protein